jgi:hypothetical protein
MGATRVQPLGGPRHGRRRCPLAGSTAGRIQEGGRVPLHLPPSPARRV